MLFVAKNRRCLVNLLVPNTLLTLKLMQVLTNCDLLFL